MYISMFCGIIFAVGHHFFYQFWNDKLVTSDSQQRWIIRGGTAFAFCAKLLLVISVSQAFIQQMWLTLEKSPHTVSNIDSLFAVLSNALQFRKLKMWFRKPFLALTALFAW